MNEIKQYIERRQRLEAEKQDAADNIKELNAEIKGNGHDLRAFNLVIARAKRNRDDVSTEDAMVEMYEDAAR